MEHIEGAIYRLTEEDIAKLTPEKKGRWKPKVNDRYYCWSVRGKTGIRIWGNDYVDQYGYATGNCFRTEPEAKFALERYKVLAEMQVWADERNGDIDGQINRFSLCYTSAHGLIINNLPYCQACGATCFTSKALALQAIDIFGERLKRYVFGTT
jgi:hypothetical protein